MTRFIKTVLIASSLLIVANPALADWQFTKWGMTPAEVQKASPVNLESGDQCPILRTKVMFSSEWKAGDMIFLACYVFKEDRLHQILLYSNKIDRDAIIRGLSQRYGSPEINAQLRSLGLISYTWYMPDEEIGFLINSRNGASYPYTVNYRSKAGSNENSVRDGL